MSTYPSSGARDSRVFEAVLALRNFVDVNLASSKIELEAKLIDSHLWKPPFEPAHLHNAIQLLIKNDEIERVAEKTRGGGRPPLLITTSRAGRGRRVDDVAARKRLLMSRYYSYAMKLQELVPVSEDAIDRHFDSQREARAIREAAK